MRGIVRTKFYIYFLIVLIILATCLCFIPNNKVYAEEDSVLFDIDMYRQVCDDWIATHDLSTDYNQLPYRIFIEKYDGSDPFKVTIDSTRQALVINFNGKNINFLGLDKYQVEGLFATQYYSSLDNSIKYNYVLIFIQRIYGLENLDFSNIISAKSMFRGLNQLKEIDLSQARFDICEDFSYMFYGCSKLETLTMPNVPYGMYVKDIRGILYNVAVRDLDLSNFAAIRLDRTIDYLTHTSGDYPNVVKDEYLQHIKIPKNIYLEGFDLDRLPRTLMATQIDEFAEDVEDFEPLTTIGRIIEVPEVYRVGTIEYIVVYNGEEYVVGEDKYLSTRQYKSKEFTNREILQAMGKKNGSYSVGWVNSKKWHSASYNFIGEQGEIMSYTPTSSEKASNLSPVANVNTPTRLYANINLVSGSNLENMPIVYEDSEIMESCIEPSMTCKKDLSWLLYFIPGIFVAGVLIYGIVLRRRFDNLDQEYNQKELEDKSKE